jgi:hypothetical protein
MNAVVKRLIFGAARYAGVNSILLRSSWRQQRLLILCYHGVSLDDEHEWSGLYMPVELFRKRLTRIRELECAVLPLQSAVEALYKHTLPPRAVVLTFDDGFYDFYAKAWPELQRFGWPVTVYLTTYYSYYNAPVFDPMLDYLLWKGRGAQFAWPDMGVNPALLDDHERAVAKRGIAAVCAERRLSGR